MSIDLDTGSSNSVSIVLDLCFEKLKFWTFAAIKILERMGSDPYKFLRAKIADQI
jgi:hypothetical protein